VTRALVLLVALAATAPATGPEEVVVFVNGDRLSGTIAARGTKRVRLKTPYGLLVIPNERIERLIHADGREEVVNPPLAPPPPVVRLLVVVVGDTFWQAWAPQRTPADPSLRLSAALDGKTVATYLDAHLDPDDLPGAVVNSFVFSPERLFVQPAPGVKAVPPERVAARVRLALELPVEMAGSHRLGLAYEVNDALVSAAQWRAVIESETVVELSTDRATVVRLAQERGQMEFHRGSMRRVETFRATVENASAP